MTGKPRPRRNVPGGGGRSLSWRKQKSVLIHEALTRDPVDVETLRAAAVTEGGLLSQEVRRRVWPKLLNINVFSLPPKPGPAIRANHRDYNQVLMDVRRSLRRFPTGMAPAERSVLQEQLMDMILYVLHSHPELHYYQGYHDVAVTLLLTVGLRLGTAMLQTLSTHHLRDFMDPTMERTRCVLSYLMPLIQSESPALHDFLLRSEVGCIFALSWLITWYGHVLSDFHQVLRIYDFFLASHPLTPVYCAAQMVLLREDEVLQGDCDLPSVHRLLSTIPRHFPYETLIARTHRLLQRHPPAQLERQTSLQPLKSISSSSFRSLQISSARQRPDFVLRQQDLMYVCPSWLKNHSLGGARLQLSISSSSFRSLQISSARQRPDFVLRQQVTAPCDVLPARPQNTLVKLAVWGISASLGAAALAVTQTALEWGPDLLLGLF